MARYIEKNAVVAEIERLQDAIKATAIDDRISKEQAEAYKVCVKLRFFVEDTLKAKEVDLDALGVLAEHLIACEAHAVTPKYTDKELDLLEEWAKNNKPQKGE